MELPKLKFDYFQMHEQSMALARLLDAELSEDFQLLATGDYGTAGSRITGQRSTLALLWLSVGLESSLTGRV
jgi:hypothetical protein